MRLKTKYLVLLSNLGTATTPNAKISDITNLATNTFLNAKINEVKKEIPSTTNLATTIPFNAVE